jgi:hypothetical protein
MLLSYHLVFNVPCWLAQLQAGSQPGASALKTAPYIPTPEGGGITAHRVSSSELRYCISLACGLFQTMVSQELRCS